jgi:hypothetical protein
MTKNIDKRNKSHVSPKHKSKLSKKPAKKNPRIVKLLVGGGCNAPDVVSHYISPPNSNIPAGYNGVQSIFQRVFYSPGAAESTVQTVAPPSYAPFQAGGGYMVDPAQTIGKVPVIHGYAPRAEPVILNGEVLFSNGCESQCGGSKKISSSNIKNKMTQRKSRSLEKKKKSQKVKESRRHGSLKKSHQKKVVRKEKKRSHRQKGGNEGVPGNFSPDMMTRDFSGKQPVWNVNTI